MSERDEYPAGVPCRVVALQRDPQGACAFYGPLFGWDIAGPGPAPGAEIPDAFVARVRGREVAALAPMPPTGDVPPAWMTHVRVDSAAAVAEKAASAGGTVVAGPLDLSPSGRLTVIADPGGATLCAWEAGDHEGAELVNEPGAWAMSMLQTPDPEGAIAFYGEVFGWEREAFGPFTLCRLPGYVGGEPHQPVPRDVVAVIAGAAAGEPARWGVDFWVDGTDATAARAAELGGHVVAPPYDTPGFRQAVLADPEGATFSISQLVL